MVQWSSPSPLYSTFMAGIARGPAGVTALNEVCALRAFSADARSPDARFRRDSSKCGSLRTELYFEQQRKAFRKQ